MENYTDGYVDPKDGLTWSEERSCWLSPLEVEKRDGDVAKAAAKVERARKTAARLAQKNLERVWILVNEAKYDDRADLTLAYRAHFGMTRRRIATLYREIDQVLIDDGQRSKPFASREKKDDGTGIARLPMKLTRINEEEVNA